VSTKTPDLDLSELESGMPALTPAMGAVLKEAASVCLSDNGHTAPVTLHQKRSSEALLLQWSPATDVMNRTYNDMPRTTELGACGIAILVVRKESGLTVVEQSRKGTGFDYWLGADSINSGTVPGVSTSGLDSNRNCTDSGFYGAFASAFLAETYCDLPGFCA